MTIRIRAILLLAVISAFPVSSWAGPVESGKGGGQAKTPPTVATLVPGAEPGFIQVIDTGLGAGAPGPLSIQTGDPSIPGTSDVALPLPEPVAGVDSQQGGQAAADVPATYQDPSGKTISGIGPAAATSGIQAESGGSDAPGVLADGGENPLRPVRRSPTDRIWKAFMEIRGDFGLHPRKPRQTEGEGWASGIATRIAEDMRDSSRILPFKRQQYILLYSGMVPALRTIGHNADHRRDRDDAGTPKFASYPVAGDPLHWGHIYIALNSAAKFGLDKVSFTFQGSDSRKAHLTDVNIRRPINNAILAMFGGLFENSGIENTDPGERNLFRMMTSRAAEWLYLAGADHGKRYADKAQTRPDTQMRLLQHMADRLDAFDPKLHKIVAAFIRRNQHDIIEKTELPVVEIEEVPVEISSTMVRDHGRYDLIPYLAFKMALDMAPRILLERGVDLWGLNHWIGQRAKNPTGDD